jgi:hypothetical protein
MFLPRKGSREKGGRIISETRLLTMPLKVDAMLCGGQLFGQIGMGSQRIAGLNVQAVEQIRIVQQPHKGK